jgi:hypothetical protein
MPKWGKLDVPLEPPSQNKPYYEGNSQHGCDTCGVCIHLRKAGRKVFCQISGERRNPLEMKCDFYQGNSTCKE